MNTWTHSRICSKRESQAPGEVLFKRRYKPSQQSSVGFVAFEEVLPTAMASSTRYVINLSPWSYSAKFARLALSPSWFFRIEPRRSEVAGSVHCGKTKGFVWCLRTHVCAFMAPCRHS
jgi:hypothetical protein